MEFLIYFFGWCCFYMLLHKYNKRCCYEWNSRILALSHSLIVTRLTEIYSFYDLWYLKDIGANNSFAQQQILLLSTAYFIFDTIWCLYMQTEGYLMIAHHIVSVYSLYAAYYLQASGYEVCLMLWAAEFTNPFLQIRWFLREKKLDGKLYAQINEALFVITFILLRLFFATSLFWQCIVSPRITIWIQISAVLIHSVSLMFVWQVLGLVKRRFTGTKSQIKIQKTS